MNLTSHLPRVMAALALVVGMTQCGGPAAPAEEAASAPTPASPASGCAPWSGPRSPTASPCKATWRPTAWPTSWPNSRVRWTPCSWRKALKSPWARPSCINTDVLQKQRAELTTQLELAQTSVRASGAFVEQGHRVGGRVPPSPRRASKRWNAACHPRRAGGQGDHPQPRSAGWWTACLPTSVRWRLPPCPWCAWWT